ncbi:hypothetical protein KNO81_12335 [Paraburkholderia sediminicola]|nr:hypothetical protein [Paraburkholderia sediminicola]
MQQLPATLSGNTLHVGNNPDAIKAIVVEGPLAKRFADLALHRKDLRFAEACLIETRSVAEDKDLVQEALWRCAIVHFAKCFGDGNRFQLSAEKIFKTEPPEAMICFKHFKELRNKHVIHDANSFAQSIPTAGLNDGKKPYKIEEVTCTTIVKDTLVQGSYEALSNLVRVAREWVEREFDALAARIKSDLEAESYADLCAKPEPSFNFANWEDVAIERPKK